MQILFQVYISDQSSDSMRPFAESYANATARRDLVKDVASDLLRERIAEDLIGAAGIIAAISPSIRASGRYRNPLNGPWLPEGIASESRKKLADWFSSRALRDPKSSVISLQWYGLYRPGSVAAFGLREFRESYFRASDFDGLSWIVLSATEEFSGHFIPPWVSRSTLLRVLNEIGANSASDNFRNSDQIVGHEDFIPSSIWSKIFAELAHHGNALVGAAIIYHLESKLNAVNRADGTYGKASVRDTKRIQRHLELADSRGGSQFRENLAYIEAKYCS